MRLRRAASPALKATAARDAQRPSVASGCVPRPGTPPSSRQPAKIPEAELPRGTRKDQVCNASWSKARRTAHAPETRCSEPPRRRGSRRADTAPAASRCSRLVREPNGPCAGPRPSVRPLSPRALPQRGVWARGPPPFVTSPRPAPPPLAPIGCREQVAWPPRIRNG